MTRFLTYSICFFVVLSCVRLEKIKDGETAFDRKYFSQAIELLPDEISSVKDPETKAYKAYLLAQSYKNIGEVRESAKWLKTSYENYPVDKVLEEYAYAMKQLEEYEQAIFAFQRLSNAGNRGKYNTEISTCKSALLWKRSPTKGLKVEALSGNTGFMEYPTALQDNGALVVTYEGMSESEGEIYNWTGNSYMKVGEMFPNSSERSPNFEFDVSSKFNVGDLIVYDHIAFYTVCDNSDLVYDNYCKIFYRQKSDDFWSEPMMLPNLEARRNYVHPTFDEARNILYLSSNQGLDSLNYDIFAMRLDTATEEWTEMIPVEELNTERRELFPRIFNDTMYFASDHGSMGGLDIFYTRFDGFRWRPKQNLKSPINSGADDFAFVLNKNPKPSEGSFAGYFASSRNSNTKDDIFKVYTTPEYEDPSTTQPEDEPKEQLLTVLVMEKIYRDPKDPNSGVKEYRNLQGAEVFIDAAPYFDTSGVVNFGGYFKSQISPLVTQLEVRANKKDYLTNSEFIQFSEIASGEKDTVRVILDPIIYNTEIVLNNIYFDLDKSDIRPDARPTLDSLATLMTLNPDLNIELSSHTDCQGTIGYNEDLANRRAYSSVQYLISAGVPAERMIARGYGESRPRVNCECEDCTPAEHQENRRTSFTILKE